MRYIKTIVASSAISLLMLSPLYAAEMDHSQHQGIDHSKHMKMQTQQTGKLGVLGAMSKSGTAREAGFDGRYIMESNTTGDDVMILCAKASRGLIMVDNQTWAKCGGKPAGLAKGPVDSKAMPMDHSQHMKH